MPSFSVIIPLYNRRLSIWKSIESVINQSFADWQLIIVDDSSTDDSVEIVKEYQKKDNRIKLIELEENKGPANARNIGIKASSSTYISLLDSDDWYESLFLEKSLEKLRSVSETVGFIWTGVRIFKNDKITESFWKPTGQGSTYQSFLHELRIGTNTGISLKREVFDKCGYFVDRLPAAEDTEFFLRIGKIYDFDYVAQPLINIDKTNNDRLSKNFRKVGQAYNIFIAHHLTEINKSEKLQIKYFYKMMWLNYHIPNKKEARKYFEKLRKLKLLNIRVLLVFIIYEVFGRKMGSSLHKRFSSV